MISDMFAKFDGIEDDPEIAQQTSDINNTYGFTRMFQDATGFQTCSIDNPFTKPCNDWNMEMKQVMNNSIPVLYNIGGNVSTYPGSNWGGSSDILKYIDDPIRYGIVKEPEKLDPNRIFSSEINGLRTIASEQHKVVKVFEKRLMESLTEKGKMGLNESDIEAMSALTAARGAITNIQKEQVAIKKNIADIRIKQAQLDKEAKLKASMVNGDGNGVGSKTNISAGDVSRAFLDDIFNVSNAIGTVTNTNPGVMENIPSTTVDDVGSILDSMGDMGVNPNIKYESIGGHVAAELNPETNEVTLKGFDRDGNYIPGYEVPKVVIDSFDINTGKAKDCFGVEYDLV